MISENKDLSTCLRDFARSDPSRLAVTSPAGDLTAAELDELSDRCAAGLHHAGIVRGTRTALMVTPGPAFLILTFGLVRVGAVLVVVDPGMGWDNLKACLGEAAPEAFVGITRAHFGRLLFGWGRSTIRTCVSVGAVRLPGWIPFGRLLKPTPGNFRPPELDPDQVAAIVFTSGSTGVPKGVVYTHRMFAAQVSLLQREFGISAGEVDLATFPLFALFDAAWQVTSVFPRMDFTRPAHADPREIVNIVTRSGATHMFGSPALLNRLGRYCEKRGIRLPGLRRVLSAGAPVPDHVLVRLQNMLGNEAQVYTPYGATEALPVCSICGAERLAENPAGRGVCLGRPLKGVGLAVIRISDSPIPEWSDDLPVPDGEVGELVVWGENVSRCYYQRPEADRLAKIHGSGDLIRHRMGDLGFVDAKGRVWFCGRKSHRVVTERGTLFTIPCESVFNQHPAVFRTALVGLGPAPHQKPVLCVELEDKRRWEGDGKIGQELLELGATDPQTAEIREILFHRGFPVDIRHNAKIFREKLAIWAEKELRAR
ncbi:MAG: peptide synthase [Acidobacteria bacterium]|nr:MAG: peptide synthase [Acidobacteriota bacterium]